MVCVNVTGLRDAPGSCPNSISESNFRDSLEKINTV